MASQQTDIAIVGSGLAGSLLALALDEQGVDWKMVSDPDLPGASGAAGALVNPLSGRRFTQPPELDWLMEGLRWAFAGDPAWKPRPILRLFGHPEQLEWVQKRRQDPDYQPWLGEDLSDEADIGRLKNSLGGVWVKGGGVMNVREFLQRHHARWRTSNRLVYGKLDYAGISSATGGVRIESLSIAAERLVFCEGAAVVENPWFAGLPITPIKGEVLTIHVPGLELDHPLIGKRWLIPIGNDGYHLGATHERGKSEARPTDEGRAALLEDFQAMLATELPVVVLDHRAGIRPGRSANQAVIGFHPVHSQLGIFNGLGSKGCLLGPAHARLMARHIAHDAVIPDPLSVAEVLTNG